MQLALFPGFVEVADELALDFDEHLRALRAGGDELTAGQQHAIDLLDLALEAMSGNAPLWEVAALEQTPEWAHVRVLARQLIEAMAWSAEPPPTERAIYVSSREP